MTDYEKSIKSLAQYIKENKKIPTEKVWNKIAYNKNCLTSQSLSYLSGIKFSELCKNICKQESKEN